MPGVINHGRQRGKGKVCRSLDALFTVNIPFVAAWGENKNKPKSAIPFNTPCPNVLGYDRKRQDLQHF